MSEKCPVCKADVLLEHLRSSAKRGLIRHLIEFIHLEHDIPKEALLDLHPKDVEKKALELGFEFDADVLATIKRGANND